MIDAEYLYLPFTLLLVATVAIAYRAFVYLRRGDSGSVTACVGSVIIIGIVVFAIWNTPGFKWP